jgi:peptide/nickel transport system permease protein
MIRLVATRVAQAALVAWAIATLSFAFLHALPGDLALQVAAARVGEDRVTPELAERIRQEEGLDRGIAVQYADWLMRLGTGDFGRSLVSRKPVVEELGYHARFTLGLGAAGWLAACAFALPLGAAAGYWPGGALDRTVQAVSVLAASAPPFLIGLGFVGVFALGLGVLPAAGHGGPVHMVLPCLTLAVGLAAYSVRVVRNAVADVRVSFFLIYGEMRGLTPAEAFLRHGLRNAAVPVVTFLALQFAFVVDGFVIVETLFAYPGLGALLVKSLLARDVPVVAGAGVLIGTLYALVNLAADLACRALDPRRRHGGPL